MEQHLIGSKFYDGSRKMFFVQVYDVSTGESIGEYSEKDCSKKFPECNVFSNINTFRCILEDRLFFRLWLDDKITYEEYKKHKY